MSGKVILEKSAKIIGSRIRGPAIIGAGSVIERSYVGPSTSVYTDCRIIHSEIEFSMVLENSRIVDIEQRIDHSLIGRNVEVTKSPVKPRAYRLVLGDHSRVGIL